MEETKSITAIKFCEFTGHSASVYALEHGSSPDKIFSGSGDFFLAEWDLEKILPEKFSIKTEATIYSICNIAELGILILGNSNGSLHIIDLKIKKEIKNIFAHTKGVFKIDYNRKKNHFYSLGGDGYLNIWDVNNFELKIAIKISEQKLRSLSIHQNGERLAIACGDGTIRIFETDFYNEISNTTAHLAGVTMVCFHPDGKRIVSGGKDALLNIWIVNDTEIQLEKTIPAHHFSIYAGVFSPDQKFFATCSRDKTIKIWSAASFDFLLRIDRKDFKAHTHSVNALLWNENSNFLISAGDDKKVMVWKIGS